MKKFIALGVALMMLFFGFAAATEVTVETSGIQVCEDIEPQPEPYDEICL